MSRDLTKLFNPSSIAVIGASENPQKVGAIALKNIISSGYSGIIYPINPNVTNVGQLKFYSQIGNLPEVPDLVVIAIPAKFVIAELEKCGQFGVKDVVIFSAGFKEVGNHELEQQLLAVANKYQLNIIGPNCLGFTVTNPSLNVTFGEIIKTPGTLNIISQSGALATALFDWCQASGLGFNSVTTIGNKSILNENDILEHWLQHPSPIGLYLESVAAGQELVKIISKITPNNPVFILKPGKSKASASAMSSHTGSIAGEDKVFAAAIAESGAIRCHELGDFLDLAQAFSWTKAPLGPAVAIISNAGGPGVLATDTIIESGLEMAKLSTANPVDVLGDALADRFAQALESVLQQNTSQSVLVILTPQLMTEVEKTAAVVSQLSTKYPQPIFCSFIGGEQTAKGQKILNEHHIPNYPFPEQAVKVIAAMWHWQNWRTNLKANNSPITQINIPSPPSQFINNIDEANKFAEINGWPIVLKLITPKLLHKADVGGVIINLRSSSELSSAFSEMTKKITNLSAQYSDPIKIQIQKQIIGGIEVILGLKRDPNFGPVLLFGAGGKYAEILDDHNLALAPLSVDKAKELVARSKVFKLLSGYRDDPAYNLEQLYQIISQFSRSLDNLQIMETEINPLIITHENVWAVDTKIVSS